MLSKIKLEHSMAEGLRDFLESIKDWPEIQRIIPGRISRVKGQGSTRFKIQYDTSAGLKCLYRRGSTVQEVFFVSSERNLLRSRLESVSAF
jgi:hypothetical protein